MAQHEIEIVVGAEGVVPRQPIEQHERRLIEERPDLRELLLVRGQHAVGVDDPLGQAGGAGREQELGDGIGTDRSGGLLQRRARLALRHFLERRDAADPGTVAAGDDLDPGQVERRERLRERRGIGDIDEARREQLGNMLELGVILALQRIGDRDRRHGNAGGVAGEREQGMVDAIAGEQHHRPLGRKPALDEPLRQRIDERPRRLIGQLAPVPGGHALRQEQPAGIALDRTPEQARQTRIVRRQRLGRAAMQAAVGAFFADDPGRAIGDRAQRRRSGHLVSLHKALLWAGNFQQMT